MALRIFTSRGTPALNSVEVYRGPSRIDGAPIVVLVTGLKGSSNSKTGNMVQSYILRADASPLDALRTGRDVSICGGCPLRPTAHDGEGWSGRACYVNVAQGPTSLWKAWQRGSVPAVPLATLSELVQGRRVRLGTYGDPAAVPLDIWQAYTSTSDGWTGYTHQARSPKLRDILQYCQVSADSLDDARNARRAGIGSFRVLREGEAPAPFEVVCPASEEAGKVATCATCGLCNGFEGASVVIAPHGIGKSAVRSDKRRALSLPVLNPGRAA